MAALQAEHEAEKLKHESDKAELEERLVSVGRAVEALRGENERLIVEEEGLRGELVAQQEETLRGQEERAGLERMLQVRYGAVYGAVYGPVYGSVSEWRACSRPKRARWRLRG